MTSCTPIVGAGVAAAEGDIEAPAIYSGGRMRKNLICCRLECCCVYKSTGKTSFRFHLEFLGFSFLVATRKHLITFSGLLFLFFFIFHYLRHVAGFLLLRQPAEIRTRVQRIQLILRHKENGRTDGCSDECTISTSSQGFWLRSGRSQSSRVPLVIADPPPLS